VTLRDNPSVSVVIPCFNQARFLAQAVNSALAQVDSRVEVIVVNDGSADETAAVAAAYGDRIKYIEQANQGLCAARNVGIRHATGEFLQFLDADDFIAPSMHANMTSVLAADPGAVAAYTGCTIVDHEGKPVDAHAGVPESKDVFHRLLEFNPWPPHALIVRRRAVEAAGCFDLGLRSCEDWDLWLRIAVKGGSFRLVPGNFAYYRRYPGSMSRNSAVMFRAVVMVIRRGVKMHRGCAICTRSAARGVKLAWLHYGLPEMHRCLSEGRLGLWMARWLEFAQLLPASARWSLGDLRHRKRQVISGVVSSFRSSHRRSEEN